MNKTISNSAFETFLKVIASKDSHRGVIYYSDGEELLMDFSNDGEPIEDESIVGFWSRQKWNENNFGTDELAFGNFSNYTEAFDTVCQELTADPKARFVCESF